MLDNYLYKLIIIEVPKPNNTGLSQIQLQNSSKEVIAVVKTRDIPAFLASIQAEQLEMGKMAHEFINIKYSDLETQPKETIAFATNIFCSLVLGATFLFIKGRFP